MNTFPPPQDEAVSAEGRQMVWREGDRLRRYYRRLRIMLPILIALAFIVWGFTTCYIPSESMVPTLMAGDHTVAARMWLAYPFGGRPSRGDIILFKPPPELKSALMSDEAPGADPAIKIPPISLRRAEGELFIKRIVGLPNEVVWIKQGRVRINGVPLPTSVYPGRVVRSEENGYLYGAEPLKLGPTEYFVMGDNAEDSEDSRYWGPLDRKYMVARHLFVIYHEGDTGPNARKAEAIKRKQSGP